MQFDIGQYEHYMCVHLVNTIVLYSHIPIQYTYVHSIKHLYMTYYYYKLDPDRMCARVSM